MSRFRFLLPMFLGLMTITGMARAQDLDGQSGFILFAPNIPHDWQRSFTRSQPQNARVIVGDHFLLQMNAQSATMQGEAFELFEEDFNRLPPSLPPQYQRDISQLDSLLDGAGIVRSMHSTKKSFQAVRYTPLSELRSSIIVNISNKVFLAYQLPEGREPSPALRTELLQMKHSLQGALDADRAKYLQSPAPNTARRKSRQPQQPNIWHEKRNVALVQTILAGLDQLLEQLPEPEIEAPTLPEALEDAAAAISESGIREQRACL